MSREFQIIQLQINEGALRALPSRPRDQIIACMHAHNELAVMNRLLMFSCNAVAGSELHDHAQGVQMWCIMQILAGKLFETWKMLDERMLKANPTDPAIIALNDNHQQNFAWLKNYFSSRHNALRIIRDKGAFHYDIGLNLDAAVAEVSTDERRVYLAEHPANGLYYLGSSLVFRTVFAMVADKAINTAALSQIERMREGVSLALADIQKLNVHLHAVLYGLLSAALATPEGAPLAETDQLRIQVVDAPQPQNVALPIFLDIEAS